jgi:hypothetical protein
MMKMVRRLAILGVLAWSALSSTVQAQTRPYIGYVYPAGGQQGSTYQSKLGGQGLDDIQAVIVSGAGVEAKVVEYYRRLSPQEMTLLREQLNALKRAPDNKSEENQKRIAQIEKRMSEYVNRPASVSISSLAVLEFTIAPDAEPGEREMRLVTPRGVSNPLVVCVGQVPEYARKPMLTSNFQVLGKEELALRRRPAEEVEVRIQLPCTLNGQVASGEVNRYRFDARKGQRLVISAKARQLIPFIADAVPGWFQPVLALYDAKGKEVAFNDDYRFRPDPIIFYEVPQDGEYLLTMTDAIYRGREDFVYRISIGELPCVTSIFPLGGRVGTPVSVTTKGWNLESAELTTPNPDAEPGIYSIVASQDGIVANEVPFALDNLPECLEREPNNSPAQAQPVELPIIVNGRIDRVDDWDVFAITGRAGDSVVAEVSARRLDSPLDSTLKVTDESGKLLAFNDDHEDVAAGVNTHHADSYVMVSLPADGTYHVHLGDTTRNGGDEYAYRLRISAPRPGFALRAVPSSLSMRTRNSGSVTVYALRQDGFQGPIKLTLKDPPAGLSSSPITLTEKQEMVRLNVRAGAEGMERPVGLLIEGRAKHGEQELVSSAVPTEDRMQAFLWRHLVPAQELTTLVYDPARAGPPKRVYTPPAVAPQTATPAKQTTEPPKFTKQQVAGRLRQLKLLYEEGLLTDAFYGEKLAECEAAQ